MLAALAASAGMLEAVRDADARIPAKARRAAQELQAYARRLSTLTDELQEAVEREVNYHLWRKGKPYVE